MADLIVTSAHLETLANRFDQTAGGVEQVALKNTDMEGQAWLTYGPLFAEIIDWIAQVEGARRGAVKRIENMCTDQATNLRDASRAYLGTDSQAGENLDGALS